MLKTWPTRAKIVCPTGCKSPPSLASPKRGDKPLSWDKKCQVTCPSAGSYSFESLLLITIIGIKRSVVILPQVRIILPNNLTGSDAVGFKI